MTTGAAGFDLTGDEVHVWYAALDAPLPHARALERTLGVDERARADRFRRAADRRRFVARRAILRQLLSRYTRVDPVALAFRRTHAGKPALVHPLDAGLTFNASHARDLALVAIAWDRRIGVDVEALRTLRDLEGLARASLSARELEALWVLPPRLRNAAFLTAWTRKEAVLKAIGTGLTTSPERIEVTLAPDEGARLRAVDGDTDAAAGWSLRALPTGRRHVAALALEGRVQAVVYRRFTAAPPRRPAERPTAPPSPA